MPTFIIEREIPGASALTHHELAAITAKSNDVVAGLGVPYRWITSYVAGDKIYCVHETDRVETILDHARGGGFPADLVAQVAEQLGPHFPTQAVAGQEGGLMRGVVRAAASVAAVVPTGAGAAGAGTLSRSQSDLAEVSRRPGAARPGKELDMFTTRSRRLVTAAAGLALAAGLATGCGSASSEPQAAAVADSADAVQEPAPGHLAMDRALAQRLIREHRERPAAIKAHDHLAMDRALAQRLIREHRERLAEIRAGSR